MFEKANSRKFISIFLMLALLMSMSLMAGCGKSEETAAPAPEQTDTRTIVDQAGREVVIPAEVNRIVTTWRPCSFLVFAVGGQDKIVGCDTGTTKSSYTTGVYPEIANIPTVGDKKGINMEELMATQPEVVFVWSGKGSEELIKQLESQGVAAVVLIPESAAQMKEATLLLGEILDCTENAQKVIDYYDATIAMVAEKLKDLPEAERAKVYLAGANGVLSSCGSDFYQHYLIEKAGGINVAAELQGGWAEVSPEQMVAWNPEVIVADPYCKESMEDAVKMNPGLNAVQAVKDGELYSFPSLGQWSFPIPQSAMGILWMAKILYPDQFADIDLEAEVDKYYQDFFGKTYTELGGKNLDAKGIAGQSK
jgi:iron complex transport system substrate-binding protein